MKISFRVAAMLGITASSLLAAGFGYMMINYLIDYRADDMRTQDECLELQGLMIDKYPDWHDPNELRSQNCLEGIELYGELVETSKGVMWAMIIVVILLIPIQFRQFGLFDKDIPEERTNET